VSIAVAFTVVSVLHMLFGEMVPKNPALAPPLMAFVRVFRPVIVTLTAAATGVLKLLKTEPVSEIGDAANRDAVSALISESRKGCLLPETPHGLMSGALEFEDRTAGSVELPLTALVTVPPDVSPDEVEGLVTATGFTRFPVQAAEEGSAGATGELIGYLHLADVLGDRRGDGRHPAVDVARPVEEPDRQPGDTHSEDHQTEVECRLGHEDPQ
jgi:CBS domain containing-hemolysin-like protein